MDNIKTDIYSGMASKRIALTNVNDIKNVLKKEIAHFLKENNLSQYGAGKICDLPASYINQILGSDEKPVSFAKLCQVASKVGMKLTLLIEKDRR